MAFPDNYPGASAPAKASRFSSLKIFGKSSKAKEGLKPPPPPPKDPYYLNNRSLVSLSYPQEPIPPTPASIGTGYTPSSTAMGPSKSQYAASVHSKRLPLNPTTSSLSLASSASLVSSPSETSAQQQQLRPSKSSSSQKISGLFKFRRGTKSPGGTSATVDDEIMSLQSNADDENISTPWNFQHNIHVDDALTGLPPSWTVSLANLGYTDEQIAAINARKQAGTLTPGHEIHHPSYGYDRPRSPAISIASSAASSSLQRPGTASSGSLGSTGASPILTHPLPRTTSLPKNANQDNRQTIVASPARIYSPSPNLVQQLQQQPRPTHSDRSRNNSTSSIPLSVLTSASELGRMRPNVVAVQGDEEAIGATTLLEHRRNRSGSIHSRQPSRAASLKSNRKESPLVPPVPVALSSRQVSPISRPSTPPRREYFVANSNTPLMQSPPPSYSVTAEGIPPSVLGQVLGPNGYPLEKLGDNGRAATGLRHQNQRSTDTTRSGSSSTSQNSPSRPNSTKSPRRPNHQHSQSSVSLQSSGSSPSDGEGLKRSISSRVATNRASKRRSKRVFDRLGDGLNLSLDLGLGLDSWSESLINEIDTKETPSKTQSKTQYTDSSSFISASAGISNTAGNRDTIKPPPQEHRSVMDRPRPKPPAPVAGLPPRVHVILDDSPVSSASPSTTTFTPSPSATFFNKGALSSPLKLPWSFSEGELGVGQDSRQTFPVSPGFMSDVSSINSVSPRTGLFDEIAGMVGIRLDDEEHRECNDDQLDRDRLNPKIYRNRTGDRKSDENENQSPALSETHSPIIPISPPYATNGHGNGNAIGRGAGGWNRISAYRIQDRSKMEWVVDGDGDEEDRWRGENGQIEEEEDTEDDTLLTTGKNASNRNSSRSSTSTVSTLTATHVTATSMSVKAVVAKIERATVLPRSNPSTANPTPNPTPATRRLEVGFPPAALPPPPPPARSKSPVTSLKHPASPQDSTFGSEEGSASAGSLSGISSSSRFSGSSVSQLSPMTEDEDDGLVYYLEGIHSPGPDQPTFETNVKLHEHHHLLSSATDTFGGVIKDDEQILGVSVAQDYAEEDDDVMSSNDTISHVNTTAIPSKPMIVISTSPVQPGPVTAAMLNSTTPITPAQRYPGWLSEVLKPLEEFIDEAIDPREYYHDLQEIAEGESGSVFIAHVTETGNIHKLKLPPLIKVRNADNQMRGVPTLVAIKCVQIVPTGSTKLEDLRKELVLLKGLSHPSVLSMDALYVDLVEDSLWIRMELMERSLADVVELVEAGLMLQERMIARFTSDILEALQFLQSHRIAHRDLRSDNLLLSSEGVLKLTDFSCALKLPKETSIAFDPAGVLYWQAPEVRTGPYDALKVDVWSLGATVWEMAQTRPPFAQDEATTSDRWPPLDKPDLYSPDFGEFLRLCSEPSYSRPSPDELIKNRFVKNPCGRPVIHQLLQQCVSIEQGIQANEDNDS